MRWNAVSIGTAEQHEKAMQGPLKQTLSKVPEVTLGFWIIKIAATTLGETGGDSITMTLNWGYLIGTAIFLGLLIVLVVAQILAHKFHPVLYWATIVASTTFGTTMAISPTARSASDMPAARRYWWSASPPCLASGTGRKAPSA
jgi:hypothetical protein